MKTANRDQALRKMAYAGIMAALCYVGYAVFPAISATGTKVHIGNAFVVLGALLLGGPYGGIAGAIGLSLADILGGYVQSAPRTFICKLVIGLVVGHIADRIANISHNHTKAYIVRWAVISAIAGLGFNCVFEPALKYVWYTLLTPNAEKAASAINALIAITTYATIINAVINSVIGVIAYLALRPVLFRSGLLGEINNKATLEKKVA
ncbi:MAG: ECF transporter S component [Butyrivibrio sp.]|uniref:ECF transporter S component n=1 Tax=Butyrivibrio sp. TaxID=28121 RepID=UPI0025D48506|nr:ECF transporter S component [Butyrivibrio sp.]MCR5769953.1 ECF transporter S component [Butyrivibrio sp.]